MTPHPRLTDVRMFLPARDFALSRRFYLALGWVELWSDGSLALLELDGHRFLLQDRYVQDWAENCVVVLEVEDAAEWHRHVTRTLLHHDLPGARVSPPTVEDWGATVVHLWDPSGVLVEVTQMPQDDDAA